MTVVTFFGTNFDCWNLSAIPKSIAWNCGCAAGQSVMRSQVHGCEWSFCSAGAEYENQLYPEHVIFTHMSFAFYLKWIPQFWRQRVVYHGSQDSRDNILLTSTPPSFPRWRAFTTDSIWICLCELKSVRLDRYRDWTWMKLTLSVQRHFNHANAISSNAYVSEALSSGSQICRQFKRCSKRQHAASVLISSYFPQTSCREYIAKPDVLDEWHGMQVWLKIWDWLLLTFGQLGLQVACTVTPVLHTSAAAVGNSNLRSIGSDCWHPLVCLYGDVMRCPKMGVPLNQSF